MTRSSRPNPRTAATPDRRRSPRSQRQRSGSSRGLDDCDAVRVETRESPARSPARVGPHITVWTCPGEEETRKDNVATAIIRASRPDQMYENVQVAGVRIPAEALSRIDAALGDIVERDPAKTLENLPKTREA